jgi:hypothetical protein
MKFCYLDESGTGSEPYAIMVGIITDSYRMRPTKSNWKEMLSNLSSETGRDISEVHTKDLYRGRGPWNFRKINGNRRAEIIDSIIDWIKKRNHTIVFSSVDKDLFSKEYRTETFSSDINTIWQFMAFHITLSLQKTFQGVKKNKGNSILIFDRKVTDQNRFTKLVLHSPDWADDYYLKGKKQEKLDQIIDVPHFVDSKQVELIQLADFCCYFIRLYLEILNNKTPKQYDTELEDLKGRFDKIVSLAIPISNIYPKKGRNASVDFFYKYGIDQLKSF